MRAGSGVALVAVVALALAACSDDDSKQSRGSTTTSTSSTTSTTLPATTTTLPATTTSTAPPTTTPGITPEVCAQQLFDAWAAGNQSAAPSCASATAVQQLFAESYAPPYQGPNCQGAAGSVFCTWTGGGAAIVMEVRNATGGLPVEVISVTRTGAEP
jgi:hypothetical protein